MHRFLFFILGLGFLATGMAHAQTPSVPQLPLPLENTAQSARASALGSAFTSVEGDSSSLYLNPAGLAAQSTSRLSFLYQSLTGGMSQETLTTSFLLSQTGVLALGLDHLDFGNLQGQGVNGIPFQNPFRGSLSLGLGLPLDSSFAIGFATRYIYQYLSPASDGFSPSLSAGFLWNAFSSIRFGTSYSSKDSQSPAGTGIVKIGASGSWELLGPMLLSLDLSLPENGFHQVQMGLEETVIPELTLRVGYQQDLVPDPLTGFHGLTGGVGINLSPFTLDYGVSRQGALGIYHAASLTFELPQNKNDDLESSPPPSPTPMKLSQTLTPLTLSPFSPTLTVTSTPEPVKAVPTLTPLSLSPFSPTVTPTFTLSPFYPFTPTATPPPVLFKPAPDGSKSKTIIKKVRFKLPSTELAVATPSPELEREISALSDKVGKNPKDAEAWIALGNLYWKNGQADFAAQSFEEAQALLPQNKTLAQWLREYHAKSRPRE